LYNINNNNKDAFLSSKAKNSQSSWH